MDLSFAFAANLREPVLYMPFLLHALHSAGKHTSKAASLPPISTISTTSIMFSSLPEVLRTDKPDFICGPKPAFSTLENDSVALSATILPLASTNTNSRFAACIAMADTRQNNTLNSKNLFMLNRSMCEFMNYFKVKR